ncbi:MAG: apolipoprotein N-acyltransferase [Legionellaceae bacterium]|nr:apolipoprotein N-acyltransferase [Legionellaceae bacterium]
MHSPSTTSKSLYFVSILAQYGYLLRSLFAGILIPFSFAPFHFPGLAFLGIGLLFAELQNKSLRQACLTGFIFGIGSMGLGVSWVYISIHMYGHLNVLISAVITCAFICYTALFPAIASAVFNLLAKKHASLMLCLLFSGVWCISEYLRSTCFTGFPWLLLGVSQLDTPLKYLLPIIGLYGVGFLVCLTAACLIMSVRVKQLKSKLIWLSAFILIVLLPNSLHSLKWTHTTPDPISVGVIQANLSMRDKWDETLFWKLLQHYQNHVDDLIGKKRLIVMPESALPLPASYLREFLNDIDYRAKKAGTTLLLGIPKATTSDETKYYNTLTAIGQDKGIYFKRHLVPFGEYIPRPFQAVMKWLDMPTATMQPGKLKQPLINIGQHPIAALICYELAYPNLLRQLLPQAEWIVSISDDGWFGHSFAPYQQLQIAQTLSLQTGRYQIMANNDGLSSVIDNDGNLTSSLPAFTSGILDSTVYAATGSTPWVKFGDKPILYFSLCITLIALFQKRRYPYQPT